MLAGRPVLARLSIAWNSAGAARRLEGNLLSQARAHCGIVSEVSLEQRLHN